MSAPALAVACASCGRTLSFPLSSTRHQVVRPAAAGVQEKREYFVDCTYCDRRTVATVEVRPGTAARAFG